MVEKMGNRKVIYVTNRSITIFVLVALLTLVASITAWSLTNNFSSGAKSSISSEEGEVSKTLPIEVRVINPRHP